MIPGSHKSNIDLNWRQQYDGLEIPGAVPVTGRAGDAFLFSETVMHNGLSKTTEDLQANLYYKLCACPLQRDAARSQNCHHFYFSPEIRERFNEEQKAMTAWMELVKWDYGIGSNSSRLGDSRI